MKLCTNRFENFDKTRKIPEEAEVNARAAAEEAAAKSSGVSVVASSAVMMMMIGR